jgi:hypothetical protein
VPAQFWVGLTALCVTVATYVISRRREDAIRRAELVKSYTDTFHSSERVATLFLRIDYDSFEFSESLLGSREELDLIHLLDLLNNLALHYRKRVLRWDDIAGTTLGYAVVRVHGDAGVQAYLARIDDWDQEHSGTGAAFQFFRNLGDSLDRGSGGRFPTPRDHRWLRLREKPFR